MEQDFNKRADELIADGRFAEARTILETAIRDIPPGWKPSQDDGRSLKIAFWDQEEFLAYVGNQRGHLTKSVFWVCGSYSKAWYQLAVVATEQEGFENALFCLDCGLELDPDQPELWSEKGYVLNRLKRHDEALECYIRAASAREWAPASHMARALRGQGVQLIDLDRLDEAEAILRQSLEYEPNSEGARNELEYIERLWREREAQREQGPWFLHSVVNPPTDPLTVRLLALVEDLPSIPGPKTVGPDNYSRILDAFMKRGWAGFEEEFDRTISPGRPNYADIKQDLLREPIFSVKAHRRLAETVSGRKTVEEMFDEISQEGTRKPQ